MIKMLTSRRINRFAATASILVAAFVPTGPANADEPENPAAVLNADADWGFQLLLGDATKDSAAAAAAAVHCVGEAERILKEHDGNGYYLHFGGIQQCTAPIDQHLTVMLDKWNATTGAWVPTQRAYKTGVAGTIVAYKEPDCSSQKSTRYRLRGYGGAAGGVIATPYPYYSAAVTLTCNVPTNL